jgi:hypothetical protein
VTEVLEPRLLVRRSCGATVTDPHLLELETEQADD